MDPQDAFKNLNLIALFAGCMLPMVATPIGIGVALVVCRLKPLVNIMNTTIVAVCVVSVVILFVLLRRFLPEGALDLYGAAGVVIALVYLIRGKLSADETVLQTTQEEEHAFSVFGEDVRGKPTNARRRKR